MTVCMIQNGTKIAWDTRILPQSEGRGAYEEAGNVHDGVISLMREKKRSGISWKSLMKILLVGHVEEAILRYANSLKEVFMWLK